MNYYAHSKDGAPPSTWQPLEEHLRNVAELAAVFAKPFGGDEWARLAGLWHDLGKYHPDFQRKLDGENIRVVHSETGGHWAQQQMPQVATLLCWLIMGHHAGLADYAEDRSGAKALAPKMRDPSHSDPVLKNVPQELLDQVVPALPPMFADRDGFPDLAFFVRMLYSCLVDADFLDTESFMDQKREQARFHQTPAIERLLASFDSHMRQFEGAVGAVNECRAEVLAQCRNAAEQTGVFSLTVPTGGGKTLASLAFALRHAVKYQKRRIIYVIPYNSIIEQTAAVFRGIPGFEGAVLEHHCNLVLEEGTAESIRQRLAMQNWDAPMVVTTSVQFFESLYANRSSRCRKLHNIADSIVIFDEAQCLPPAFLRPCVFAIRELARHYGVTPVLCTATQPVLDRRESFDFEFNEGFESVTEIIADPAALSARLSRVQVERLNDLEPLAYSELAERLLAEGQSLLCIVNRKADARELAELLPSEWTIHLSTNMCAAHRLEVFAEIKRRLAAKERVLVISTSLVEAGVDLDFPVVYRALAGLDSIAQAAGRCNREGRLADGGRTVVFLPENQPDYVGPAASIARDFLREDRLPRIFMPQTFRDYFGEYFFMKGSAALDQRGILELLPKQLEGIYFREAAERFRLIDNDWQVSLVVPFGEAPKLIDKLLDEPWSIGAICRELQRYTVNVPRKAFDSLLAEDYVREVKGIEGIYFLHTKQLYDQRFGFVSPDAIDCFNWEDLIT
jgi:CRISPR-associated endonuclease/helicase Cas3